MSMHSIFVKKSGSWKLHSTIDPTTLTRSDGMGGRIPNPKPDTPQGALRAFGMAHPRKDGTGTSGKGTEYKAVAMTKSKVETVTEKPVSDKSSRRRISATKTRSRKSSDSVPVTVAADGRVYAFHADGSPVMKADGTQALKRGRKPGVTISQTRDNRVAEKVAVAAPWGLKADNVTPRAKPGRKPAKVTPVVTEKPVTEKVKPTVKRRSNNSAKVAETGERAAALADFTLRNGFPTRKEYKRICDKYPV